MEIVLLIIGIAIGFVIAWVVKGKSSTDNHAEIATLQSTIQLEREERNRTLEAISKKDLELTNLNRMVAHLESTNQHLQQKIDDQLKEVAHIQDTYRNEFKVLAQEILEKNSEQFRNQSKVNLDTVLSPFKEKLESFEKKVQETYEKGAHERIELKTEVKRLAEQNDKLNQEASNLAKALRGDVKMQGNWGEVILERILEKSGLQKDREYFVQQSLTSEDGKRFQPDVVIHLPEEKKIIVDSKVSLVAYEKFSNATDAADQEKHLKDHLLSIRAHLKGLSEKNYQNLYGIDGLDFVILFIPIESAFSAALQADQNLYQDAFDKNIVMVSTSTLLATLRTIASIWKQEYQNQNIVEIARQGGNLYDKFASFMDDMVKLGNQLNTSTSTYQSVMKKFSEGSGNLVKRAEDLKKLGLKTSKTIDAKLIQRSDNQD